MFKIFDGRDHFYQWDLDRQIEVEDATITEVHFCNRTDECSLVVDVEELTIFADGKEFTRRVANVPNIILQKSFDVRVFGYDGKATRYDKVFNVKPRTRPADYVYTETEIRDFDTLSEELNEEIDERIKAVEEGLITDGFVTKEYVDEAIDGVEVKVKNLDDTTQQRLAEIETAIPSLEGYATEKYVDNAIAAIDIPESDNCNAYVLKNPGYNVKVTDEKTIEFLDLCWAGELRPATMNGRAIGYFRKEPLQQNTLVVYYLEIKNYRYLYEYSTTFSKSTYDGSWRGGYTAEYGRHLFVTETSQLTNDSDFTTKAYVDEAVKNIEVDLTGYATEEYVSTAITNALSGIAQAEGGAY
jgi:hypothetical protein